MTTAKQPPANPVWRSGPPPAIGWWPASFVFDPTSLRWWDGKRWSFSARSSDSDHYAAWMACIKSECGTHEIQWTDPWW